MRKLVSMLVGMVLALGMAACAGSCKSEGCCGMCGAGCSSKGQAMACEKCDKKEKSADCCSKGGAEGHQH